MTDYGYGFDYLSLWKKQYVEPTKYFIPDEEDFKKNSFVFKSFRHEYEVDNAFSHKGLKLLKKMKTNDGVVQMPTKVNHLQNVPGYSPLSNIQRKSLLTQDEMNECFNLILSMKKGPLTPQQMERHNLFREKILQEQNDYLTFVRNYWIKDNYKRHAEITPEVVDLVNKMWRERLLRLSKYPTFYSQSGLISLIYQCNDEVEMSAVKVLNIKGKPKIIFEPFLMNFKMNIHSAIEHIKKDVENYTYKPMAQVIEDPLAEKLAVDNNAHIVLNSNSFATLLCNHFPSFYNSWDLPVTVKEYVSDTGAKKNIVFIDEPLPPRSMNLYDRNKWFCNVGCEYALKLRLTERRPVAKRFEKTSFKLQGVSMEGSEETDSSDSEHEFSKEKVSQTNEAPNCLMTESHVPVSPTPDNYDSSNSNDSEDCLVIADAPCSDSGKEVHAVNTPGKEVPAVNNPIKEKKKKRRRRDHVSYTLWSLKKRSQSYLSKTCSKDLTVLVNCKEGYKKLPEVKNGGFKWITSTKMEYQSEFGAERMTLDELSFEWANLFLRPNTKLLRVRLNPISGEVIMFERKTLAEISMECQNLYKVTMSSKLGSVYSVLEKLSNLTPGRYHLSHCPKNEAFVPLFKESHGPSTLNLRTVFDVKVEDVEPERSPWIPIDTNIVTPVFRYLHRVPATFAPQRGPLRCFKDKPLKKGLKRKGKGTGMKKAGNDRKKFPKNKKKPQPVICNK